MTPTLHGDPGISTAAGGQQEHSPCRNTCVDVHTFRAKTLTGAQSNFNHILRLLNTNVDGKQKVVYSLT
jgi:hypothetical protein